MIRIADIIRGIEIISVRGDQERLIENIEADSRKVAPGSVFVALRGNNADGHDFIDTALKAGAVAVICETLPSDPRKDICWIKTADSARALGLAASNFYGNPSSALRLVGVTGTNGKTTIATLLYRMFSRLGY